MPVVQSDVQMFLVEMLCESGFCDNFGAPAVARGSFRGGGWIGRVWGVAGVEVVHRTRWSGGRGAVYGRGTGRRVVEEVGVGWDC